MYTIDRKEMKVADSRSDSSELPSVEVLEAVTETTLEPTPNPSIAISSGYTVDDQGLLNNYAILTPMYIEEPTLPTAEERLRSKSQVVFAILLTAMAIFIALIVS
jgi:hypothetical protein